MLSAVPPPLRHSVRPFWRTVALLLAAMVPASASAAGEQWILDGQVGPAYLARSGSSAVGHAFKPVARLGVRVPLGPRFEVGGALSGVLDGSEHYRVLGALAHARWAVWQRPAFSLGTGAGLGAGYDADILHADLRAGGRVLPYGFVSLDGRWTLADRWLLGVEAGWDNLSIVRLGVLFGFRLGSVSEVTR